MDVVKNRTISTLSLEYSIERGPEERGRAFVKS